MGGVPKWGGSPSGGYPQIEGTPKAATDWRGGGIGGCSKNEGSHIGEGVFRMGGGGILKMGRGVLKMRGGGVPEKWDSECGGDVGG